MSDDALTRLHPDYLAVMRIRMLIPAGLLCVVGIVGEAVTDWPHGVIIGPVLLFALALILRMPLRRYRRKGYHMGEDRLRIVSGLLFHSDTVVPFGRVQHLDVLQGPLERAYDLATLVLHTAGMHNSSVILPGLAHSDAIAMRETIRGHIRREMP